jgi:hypothetical protein
MVPPSTLHIRPGNNCTLDLADANPAGMTATQIGEVFNETPRRVQQMLDNIAQIMRVRGVEVEAVRNALELVGLKGKGGGE